MENQSEKTSIQLLPEEEFEEYPLSKQLTTWIIKVGRLIIVATELIAFSVFIGRIKLDRELTDLTNALENQITILENAAGFEDDFTDLQKRLAVIKELRQQQTPTSPTIILLSSLLPSNVSLTELTLLPKADQGESQLVAKTGSAMAFAQTIQQLKAEPEISEIALTSGRFEAKEGTYSFSLEIRWNDQ